MRVAVCGEALIDLIPAAEVPANQRASASSWAAHNGGGPMTTAVALARLGCETAFWGSLSSDVFGRQLAGWMEAAGVDLRAARRPQGPTALAVVESSPKGISYTFHLQGSATFQWDDTGLPTGGDDLWLHIGSLAAVLEPGASALLDYLSRCGLPASFDINVRPTVVGDQADYWERIERVMVRVGAGGGILRASDQDIAWLVGAVGDPDLDVIDVATDWARTYGFSLVVVTLGDAGALAVKPDGRVSASGRFDVPVVDTVGAGDAFTAGFLSQWLRDPLDTEAALRRGNAAAALTCTRIAADPPTRAEVDGFLAAHTEKSVPTV
ncbi:carbohydrate kinase [Brooklawnia cerclae]|uniref:Fructokinase n=1 Tax=Brooklawnia cerclae TaxID=349934 RepID=A0ABX0SK66_9ACTN|nr:carbohydrate kinase [Brooklawnia cerclae]NIH57086.1 fructokinase [Brooklawnia cerclae]